MARVTDKSAERHRFVCGACKRAFFGYSPDLVQECPHCGHRVRTRSRRRAMRIAAVILLLAIAAAILIAYRYGILK